MMRSASTGPTPDKGTPDLSSTWNILAEQGEETASINLLLICTIWLTHINIFRGVTSTTSMNAERYEAINFEN